MEIIILSNLHYLLDLDLSLTLLDMMEKDFNLKIWIYNQFEEFKEVFQHFRVDSTWLNKLIAIDDQEYLVAAIFYALLEKGYIFCLFSQRIDENPCFFAFDREDN